MTGEWDTAALAEILPANRRQHRLPTRRQQQTETVDMSEVTFAENTSFYVSAGMQNAGVFKMCKALKSVKFPANATTANITSLQGRFLELRETYACDVSALTASQISTTRSMSTAITMADMSKWANVTKSEDAFGKCSQLASVVLPANFTIGKFLVQQLQRTEAYRLESVLRARKPRHF